MPTYDYKCPEGHLFEKFYPTISDKRRIKCPKCGKMADRQISSGSGLVFKGSGFYITDYKRAPERDGKKAGDSESKPSQGESKPAEGGKSKKDSSNTDK
jgi:putative FmdB family regulatory protein